MMFELHRTTRKNNKREENKQNFELLSNNLFKKYRITFMRLHYYIVHFKKVCGGAVICELNSDGTKLES